MNQKQNKFHIVFCDDKDCEHDYFRDLIEDILKKYPNSIDFQAVFFSDMEQMIKDKGNHIDLLILDYWGPDDENQAKRSDENIPAGMKILNLNSTRRERAIQTVFYSAQIEREVNSFDFDKIRQNYPFVEARIHKTMMPREGQERLKKIIIDKLLASGMIPPNYVINHETYSINKNISNIKKSRLIEIIDQLKLGGNNPPEIKEFGKGGLSGAIILELLPQGSSNGISSTILKLAVNPGRPPTYTLKQEHDRAKQYNDKFPRSLTNNIHNEWYSSSDENVCGFVMAKVDHAITLYDFTTKNNYNLSLLEGILNELFLRERTLKQHYESKICPEEKHNWKRIFEDFDDRLLQIRDSYDELSPLISSIDGYDSAYTQLMHFLKNKTWPIVPFDEVKWPELPLTLCHGDFHAKNILVQGTTDLAPVIIDTGSLGFDHWATDLTRLIVYLFMRGIDAGTKHYYDIQEIDSLAEISKIIIEGNPICLDCIDWNDERKNKNKHVIEAINWIVLHRKEIYAYFYNEYNCEFEFQLSLMKWFLREFYRQASPPNRRVTALLASYQCFEKVKISVESIIQKTEG